MSLVRMAGVDQKCADEFDVKGLRRKSRLC
jgi:hypothetical protein